MTIFDAIRQDHEIQRKLGAQLLETHGDSDDRRETFEELRAMLTSHAAAEERYFYVPLMEHDLTQDQARHSVAEHKELDDYVEQLESYDRSASQWLVTARQLVERLEHHLDEEEQEVFDLAEQVLTDPQRNELAADYRGDMERHLRGDAG
ncbi:MAG: hemerythrin domain-containing protein [Acidimicrobiales bacterium]